MQTIVKTTSPDTRYPTPWEDVFRWRNTDLLRRGDKSGRPIDEIHFEGRNILVEEVKRPRVLIVGTRDASPRGKQYTCQIVEALSRNPEKPIIISGLAIGIDSCAHEAALSYGLSTVAVLPTGLDTVYPHCNKGLAEKIVESGNGCLLSQFPEKTAPLPVNFLFRNATMAMLSDLVIVVESKEKGGAIVTARYSNDFGGQVLAVPGPVDEPRSKGCNWLIRQDYATILDDFSLLSDPKYIFNPLRERMF